MKTKALLILSTILVASFLASASESRNYSIAERGPHSRAWERVETETGPDGQIVQRPIRYTELETGMHYWDNGQWNETQEQIEIVADHAAASRGPHKVIFAPNVTDAEAIFLETPDGKQFRSRIIGLSYFDTSTGRAALIAETKSSEGQLLPPNRVIYPDAFDDVQADVEFIYTKAGFEQNIVLRAQLPLPAEYGLNPQTTRLQVLTEFFNPPVPARSQDMRENGLVDEHLDFGEMKMGRGKGFSVGDGTDSLEVPIVKHWTMLDGRNFLVEEVPVPLVNDQIDALMSRPRGASINLNRHGTGASVIAALKSVLPKRTVKSTTSKMRMAKLDAPRARGFVLDYTITLASATNFTFKSDTTHYVSGSVTLYGTTTFEGGAVIKYATSASVNMTPGPPGIPNPQISWLGAPYRPVIFTAKDDNSVGENISGSTGSPSGYYGSPMISLASPSASPTMSGLRMTFGKTGIQLSGASANILNGQIVNCQNGLNMAGGTIFVGNVLLNAKTNFIFGGGSSLAVQNATISTATYVATAPASPSGCNLSLTNCLLANVTNFTAGSFLSAGGGHNGFFNSLGGSSFGTPMIAITTYPFQTVNGGSHYLTSGNELRNAGAANINSDLLTGLKQRTTYPPIAFTNTTSTYTTLGPQAQRDTDAPDLGYHYDPLDYIFGKVDQNTNLTFTAGTAVGWFRHDQGWTHAGHGIHIADTKTVNFTGRVDAPCWFVHQTTVQENRIGYNPFDAGPGGLTGWATTRANRPFLNLQFTKFAGLPIYRNHIRDDNGALQVTANHCEFFGGGLGGYVSDLLLTNCLLDRVGTWLSAGNTNYNEYFAFRNCTIRGGYFVMDRQSANIGRIKIAILDTAFDDITPDTDDPHKNNASLTTYDYNGYRTGATRTDPQGANDVIVATFNWQSGQLGRFYLPNSSGLIDDGSATAPTIGLYHFTTQTASSSKETTSTVDIGYHYVGTDSSGRALDYDSDGIFDYFEDGNGNGSYQSGSETDWQTYNSSNGLSTGNGLQVFTPLK